ncbi:scabin-related ADP-ribosyltransferase [Microbacterium sp. NPDC055903]
MGMGIGKLFKDLWQAVVKGGKDADVRLPEVTRKLDDHLEDIKQKVRLLDGTEAPDLTGYNTNRVDRTTTEPLYRFDTRSPDDIFDSGFQPWNRSDNDYRAFVTRNTPSNFVSTTRDPDLVWGGNYRYTINAPGGIDADATIPDNPHGPTTFTPESEITFQGGVPTEFIVGVHRVVDGKPTDWIPNPNYGGA